MARRAARIGTRRSWRETVNPGASRFWAGVVAGFVTLVLVPTLAATVYFGAIASRQFVSEMSFAVRAPMMMSDLLGMGSIPSSQRTQDALIIADYVRSRRMVEDLDADIGLRKLYLRPEIDWLSRPGSSDPIEDIVRYWKWKVDVKVDKNSSVVTVTVKAFTPEDALTIARAVAERSEKLVNEMSERAREDAVRQAQDELARAETKMRLAIEAMRLTRNERGVLDATKVAEATTKVIGELLEKLLALEGEYEVQRGAHVSPSAPQMKVLERRIAGLKEQIFALEKRIAGASGSSSLSDVQGTLERHALETKVAEQQYALAVAKLEQARLDQATKQVYLMTFVPPRIAEDALYPRRLLTISLVLLAGVALWGCGTGFAVLVRDHMAV
jgi:capsular polysaccharide transport system permease protein